MVCNGHLGHVLAPSLMVRSVFFRMAAILVDGLWRLRAPHPLNLGGLPAPVPRSSDLVGATRPHAPGFTISHLNALRAAVRIEAYGLDAQK